MIAIVGSAADPDVASVVEKLSPKDTCFIETDLLREGRSLRYRAGRYGSVLELDGRSYDLSEITTVLYRPPVRLSPDDRFSSYVLSPHPELLAEYEPYARGELAATVLGFLSAGRALWVNHPSAELLADHKLAQLELARRIGLLVPDTLVATDADSAVAFWDAHAGAVVTKAVSTEASRLLREVQVTRMVTAEQIPLLAEATPSAVLLQEYIPAAYDLRITLVDDRVFAARINSQQGASPVDWRLDQSVEIAACRLDDTLASRLQILRRDLGLVFAAADVRMTPDGDPVFLEMNAQGAYSFIEARTGQGIGDALTDVLESHDRKGEILSMQQPPTCEIDRERYGSDSSAVALAVDERAARRVGVNGCLLFGTDHVKDPGI